ncbi:MAG: SDR family NAD(P)-dependent oxidoreductase [Gammaproteobacteria bacterium]|jgi:NAD(P)-dependent dehydrogenase (short-subunit alcohol dehydrogenase family)|nr:SDR family NAD(P)-dependent oxidoreductase [Gammaproteobacteria bacterium]
MRLTRRHLIALAAASAGAPLLAGCDGDKPGVIPDTRFPIGPFGADSTAEEVTAGLDLRGRTALVTGSTSGLGYETMRVLALRGAHVIGTGRTLDKAAEACASVAGKTTPVALELADFDSAVACARTVQGLGLRLDMLICNAGINTFGELELVNGIEKIFVVNYLGHFVLVNQLLPMMLAAGSGRIVHVASRSGYRAAPEEGIDFDNLRGEGVFDSSEAYGRSKLANALFSLSLAERLQGTGVTSNAIHPGLVHTDIARTAPAPIRIGFDLLGPLFAKTPAQGAATQVYVATSPLLDGVNGAYFEDCNPVMVSGDNHMFDRDLAQRLWSRAQEMTAGYTG